MWSSSFCITNFFKLGVTNIEYNLHEDPEGRFGVSEASDESRTPKPP